MIPLPPIADLRRDGESLRLELRIEPALMHFQGHFPETPILPAVAQIDWAVRIAREHYELESQFRGLRSLKFLRIVQPPTRLSLELARAADGRSVAFTYSQDGTACSSGRIEFAHDPSGADRSVL